MRFDKTCLLLMAVMFSGQAARANFITNGGFELPVTSSQGNLFLAGDTSITGWTIVSGSVDVHNSTFFPPFEGNQALLDLDGVSAGTIEQTFATTAGVSYVLAFEYANNPNGGTNPATATVSLFDTGGSTLLTQNFTHANSSTGTMNYTLFTTGFTADSATTQLRFTSTDPTNSVGGIILDAISVNAAAVPEPASVTLFGMGILGLAWAKCGLR